MNDTTITAESTQNGDLVRNPASAFLWWGLPILIGNAQSLLGAASNVRPLIWAAALAWMGAGCALNAYRCHRLHCYISAPAFFIGAVLAALTDVSALGFGPHALNIVIWATMGVAILSFAPETVFRKYV